MGLDISAHSKLIEVPDAERDEDGKLVRWGELIQFYNNPDFPGRFAGLKEKMAYAIKGDSEGLSCGYRRYIAWREELAKLAGYKAGKYEHYGQIRESYCLPCWDGAEGPFSEQINFSDCEGTIGPIVCAKLAKDYADFAEKAEAVGGYFWEKYQVWKKCFELGADSGAVKFH